MANKKFFVVDEKINPLSKSEISAIELNRTSRYTALQSKKNEINKQVEQSACSLKHIEGRVIVMVDTQSKNYHTFQSGLKIRRERQFNEFNKRITEPTNATVVSAENIPSGCELLISHNALRDSNRIFDYTPVSGIFEATDIRYYSIPEDECFAWRDEKEELRPMKNFCFAMRVYEPYSGFLVGIEPKRVKDVLYITTGELQNKIVHTLKASDYEIIYQGQDGREERLIRCRHYEDNYNDREEIVAISHVLTEKIFNGELLAGLNTTDAKPITENVPDYGV